MQAPDKIWARVVPNWHDGETGEDFVGGQFDAGHFKDGEEYHLAHPNQPCSDREFMAKVVMTGDWWRVEDWLSGDFDAAMEGLE